MAIDVQKGQLLEPFPIGPVDEEAGAHAGLEMAGGEVAAVEIEHTLRGATPGEAIGETMHQAVVDGEHEGRVDGVRRLDRGVRRPHICCLLSGHGWTA